jgi:hypothetical protein
MGQIKDNFCLKLKEVAIWAEIELLGFNSNWEIMEDENNYLSVPRKNVFSFREQLCRTKAEETSLLSKFMAKVRNLNHFSKSLLTTAKENYNFVINPTNYPCELSTNSLIIQMDDHIVIILCGEGVGRFPNTEIWLRGENVLMFINKGSRERIMNRRDFFQVAFASKHGRREVMKRDLDWYVVIMLNFVIGLTCCEANNMGIEASPATAASFSLPSCIQVIESEFLTFLGFHFDNCYLIFEWEYSFLSTGMESTELLYATTTSLINDLEVSFSNSSKIMLSCSNTIVMLTSQKRKKEVKVLIFALQFEIFAVEDIAYVVVKFWENAEKSVSDVLNVFSLVSIFTIFDILNDAFVTAMMEMNMKCGHDSWIHKVMVPFMKDSYDLHFWKEMMAVYGRKLQPFILGAKVTQQPLVLSSFYVWNLFNKHIREGLSTGCIYPKQESSCNDKLMSLYYSVSNRK